jgi:hypothetical protein
VRPTVIVIDSPGFDFLPRHRRFRAGLTCPHLANYGGPVLAKIRVVGRVKRVWCEQLELNPLGKELLLRNRDAFGKSCPFLHDRQHHKVGAKTTRKCDELVDVARSQTPP